MSLRTCCKTFVFVLVVLALAIQAAPAFAAGICSTEGSTAGNCLQNESCKAGVTQKLNCTANDVRVAKVINTRQPDGTPINSCTAGQTGINFVADFLVQTSSTSSRSNIGLYFSKFDVTAHPTALTGTCSDNVISPPHNTSTVSACLGSGAYNDLSCSGFGTYDELDPNEPKNTAASGLATGCGDSTSQDGTVCLTANDALGNAKAVACNDPTAAQTFTATQVVTVEITNFTCPNVASGTQVQLPNCTSWQIPGGTITCTASPNDYAYPDSPPTAIPGTPSKCNCGVVSLPIIVQNPSLVVQKACEPGSNAGDPSSPTFNPIATPNPTEAPTTCVAGPEGANLITYTVAITNTSNTGGVTIDQICDNKYGTLFQSGTFSGPACAAGAFSGTSGSNTCTSVNWDLAKSTTPTTCTFTATPGVENLGLGSTPALTDTLSVEAHGDLTTTEFGPTNSNTVTVNSSDAPSSAKTTPGPATTTNICATIEYNATVQNTSAADETIFISGLSDMGVDVTKTSTSITSTTCNSAANPFPVAGLAAVSGGTPPTNGGTYNCTFDVLFCGAPTAGAEQFGTGTCGGVTPGKCSAGQPNTVSCTKDSDCDTTCNGISHSDKLHATLTGDETSAPLDTISPVVDKTTSVTECVTTSQVTQ